MKKGTAVISKDGRYRYRLTRELGNDAWGWGGKGALAFCMLNPSTADATQDDPTIRRCMGFATREKASRLVVVNIYAFRTTDPRELPKSSGLAIGPENKQHIIQAAHEAGRVICAWGAMARPDDALVVLQLIKEAGATAYCLGKTKKGAPRHPLYIRADQQLVPYGAMDIDF